jgi:Galactose oxidase, central domain
MGLVNKKVSRRMLLRGGAVGASAIVASALVGCGSSDDETSTTSTVASSATPVGAATTTPTVRTQQSWSRILTSGGPAARRDHSLTFNPDDGLIYLFGGRAKGIADNQLWTFDPTPAAWRQIESDGAPAPRFAHNATYDAAGKRLVIAMGQGNDGAFFNDVWTFADGRWTQLDAASAERPEIRYGSGGVHDQAGNRILISHGFTDRGRFDDSWSFDLTAGVWTRIATTGVVPIKRCLTRCLWQDGSMLMFGGQTDATPFLGDFWSLDVAGGAWAELAAASLPGPRNLYGASLDDAGERWYIVGGNTPDGPTDETWVYETSSASWAPLRGVGASPPARYSSDAAHAGGKLYVFGGHDGTTEIDDVWALGVA